MPDRIIDFDDLTSLEGTDYGVIVDSSTETTKKFTIDSLTTYVLNNNIVKNNIKGTLKDLWLFFPVTLTSASAIDVYFNYITLNGTSTRIEIDILNATLEAYDGATLVNTKAIDSVAQIIALRSANSSSLDQDIDIINSGEYSDGTTSITLTDEDNLCIYLDRTNNKAIILTKVLTP
jgi:hypothetical protein